MQTLQIQTKQNRRQLYKLYNKKQTIQSRILNYINKELSINLNLSAGAFEYCIHTLQIHGTLINNKSAINVIQSISKLIKGLLKK
jgi:hypothetical protein